MPKGRQGLRAQGDSRVEEDIGDSSWAPVNRRNRRLRRAGAEMEIETRRHPKREGKGHRYDGARQRQRWCRDKALSPSCSYRQVQHQLVGCHGAPEPPPRATHPLGQCCRAGLLSLLGVRAPGWRGRGGGGAPASAAASAACSSAEASAAASWPGPSSPGPRAWMVRSGPPGLHCSGCC